MGGEDRKESKLAPGQTRREFVRNLLLHSSYVVPAVVSFTTEGVFGQTPSGMRMAMMSPPGMGMMMGRSGDIWKKADPKSDPDKK